MCTLINNPFFPWHTDSLKSISLSSSSVHSFAESVITSFSGFEGFQRFVNWACLLLVSHRSQFRNLPRNAYWDTATDHGQTIPHQNVWEKLWAEVPEVLWKSFETFEQYLKLNLKTSVLSNPLNISKQYLNTASVTGEVRKLPEACIETTKPKMPT